MSFLERILSTANAKKKPKASKPKPWIVPSDGEQRSFGTELLVPALEAFLKNDYVDPPREGGNHCSQMYSYCVRRALLDVFFKPDPVQHEPRTKMIFDTGSALHHWFQERYFGPQRVLWGSWLCQKCSRKTLGFMPKTCRGCGHAQRGHSYLEPHVRFRELDLVGHCDGILVIGDLRKVLEIKTINPAGFDDLVEAKTATVAHIYQVNIYMHLLEIPSANILYINKADNRLLEFEVPYDKRVWEDVEAKLGSFKFFMRRFREAHGGTFNARLFHTARGICWSKNSWTAKKCQHRDTCFALKDGEKVPAPYTAPTVTL